MKYIDRTVTTAVDDGDNDYNIQFAKFEQAAGGLLVYVNLGASLPPTKFAINDALTGQDRGDFRSLLQKIRQYAFTKEGAHD